MFDLKIQESVLKIMKEYGAAIYTQPTRLEALLKDFCPEYKKEIVIIVTTAKGGIPSELHNKTADQFLITRLVSKIESDMGFSKDIASLVVSMWIYAFDMVDVDLDCAKDNGCGNSKCEYCYPETFDEDPPEGEKLVTSILPPKKKTPNSLFPVLDRHGENIWKVLFSTKVAGVTFRSNAQKILEYLYKADPKEITLKFEREPDNQYDQNAVKVIVGMSWSKKTHFIGYIPRDISAFFSYLMDSGYYDIKVESTQIIGGKDIGIKDANYGIKFDYRVWIK